MIVHINHRAQSKKKTAPQRSPQSEIASLVTGSMMSMVEDGILAAKVAPSLRVHLDWIQYKTNFRDPVMVRRTADSSGRPLPLAEIAVDLRQTSTERLSHDLARAVRTLADAPDANPQQHVFLGGFTPFRSFPAIFRWVIFVIVRRLG